MKKRHFYNNVHYVIDEKTQVVKLLPDFFNMLSKKQLWGRFGFKKIGGSSIGDVLEVDQFSSEFIAFCRFAWIGIPILDTKYIDAGIAIEPLVIKVLEDFLAEKIKTFNAQEVGYDIFKDNDVVGGIPDGIVEDQQLLLEIKTTGIKNYENWKRYGVPVKYLKQAALYAYLLGYDNYSIVAVFLESQDYLDPANLPIKERRIKSWRFKVNESVVKDDIQKVTEWHAKYTKSGVSPKYDLSKHQDQLRFLACHNEGEWLKLQQEWVAIGKIPTPISE